MQPSENTKKIVPLTLRLPLDLHTLLSRYVRDQRLAERERGGKPTVTLDSEIQTAIRERLERLKAQADATQEFANRAKAEELIKKPKKRRDVS